MRVPATHAVRKRWSRPATPAEVSAHRNPKSQMPHLIDCFRRGILFAAGSEVFAGLCEVHAEMVGETLEVFRAELIGIVSEPAV